MIGTRIGDLKLIRLLGEGGMGTVYLARHRMLDNFQAVKVLDARLARLPQVVARFVNEGRAAAKLRHPNLVQVHDIGQLPNDGPWYIVMEFLEGNPLSRLINTYGWPMEPHVILRILARVLGCVQWIHDRGVVHRDLKPTTSSHAAEIRTFRWCSTSVSPSSGRISDRRPTPRGLIGTPLYMAAEQLRGGRVTPSADVFAIGMIGWAGQL